MCGCGRREYGIRIGDFSQWGMGWWLGVGAEWEFFFELPARAGRGEEGGGMDDGDADADADDDDADDAWNNGADYRVLNA